MEAASGLVTVVNLVLCLIVGARLLRAGNTSTSLPELSLGVYFVFSAFLSSIPQIVVYGSLGQEAISLSATTVRTCLASAVFLMSVGAVGIYLFTWRAFQPDRVWAAALVAAGCVCLFGGWILEAVTDGFALTILPGSGHWIAWAGRTGAMLWVAIESFRYYAAQRKRLRLGLSDPILANRFLLWAIWSATGFLTLAADLVARLVYVWMAGTSSEIVIDVIRPLVLVTITITMLLGVSSATTLFLTFFAPARYRDWLQARAYGEAS